MEENKILDTSRLIEGREGLTTIFNVVEYPKALESEIKIFWPIREDFIKSVEIMSELLKIGKPIPAIDILIASMCLNRGLVLSTKDDHYKYIKQVYPKFKLEIIK